MKNFCTIIAVLALLLLGLYLDLVICGVAYPGQMDIIAAYKLPIVGPSAKAKALEILAATPEGK